MSQKNLENRKMLHLSQLTADVHSHVGELGLVLGSQLDQRSFGTKRLTLWHMGRFSVFKLFFGDISGVYAISGEKVFCVLYRAFLY